MVAAKMLSWEYSMRDTVSDRYAKLNLSLFIFRSQGREKSVRIYEV